MKSYPSALGLSRRSVEAVFGLYYLDGQTENSSTGVTDQTVRLRFFDDHLKTTFVDDRDLESISAYANIDWDISDDWQLSIGGRYTEDEKTLNQIAEVDHSFYAHALTFTPDGIDLLDIAPGLAPGFFAY